MTAAAGAVLVLSAAILALRRYYIRQRRCRDLLWSFAAALGEMESAIRWQRTPVLPLLEVLQTREHCGVWFCQIRDKVQSDMTLQLAWENTFHQLSDAELRDLLCRISWSGDAQRLESTIARARRRPSSSTKAPRGGSAQPPRDHHGHAVRCRTDDHFTSVRDRQWMLT